MVFVLPLFFMYYVFSNHSGLICISPCGLKVHFLVFCHWCLETKCQDLFHQLFTGFKTSKVNFFLWNLISAFFHWPYLTLIKLYKMDFSIHHLRRNLIHTLHPVHFWIDFSRQKVLADYWIILERLRYHTVKRGNHSSSRSSHSLTLFILWLSVACF